MSWSGFDSPVGLLLVGDWEPDPADGPTLMNLGVVALRVGAGGDSELVEFSHEDLLRVRLRHAFEAHVLTVCPAFTTDAAVALSVSFSEDANRLYLTSQEGKRAILRRLPPGTGAPALWAELSVAERNRLVERAEGSILRFFGPRLAAFAKLDRPTG